MRQPLSLLVLAIATLLTSACHFGSPMGAKLRTTPHAAVMANAVPTRVGRGTLAVRALAQGVFMLPASLVSVGSGGLVSVGSGGLVSVGSGGLVSVGSGHYRLASLSSEQPVTGASVSLLAVDRKSVV